MSASVIQPMAAHREIYKIRSPGVSRRSQQNSVALGRVTRNLFGSCDSKEIKTFVDRELAKVNEIQSQKWGFDFMRGQPIANNKALFQWEQLTTPSREEVPEMYTLTRIAHIRRTENFFSADEDSDAANSSDELQDTRARRSNEARRYVDDEVVTRSQQIPASSVLMSPPTSAQSGLSSDSDIETRSRRQTTVTVVPRTRQARITEFLQERKKRSVATASKAIRKRSPSPSSHQSPVAKRLRVSIPGRRVQ